MPEKVLVTGAAGYIGGSVAARLVKAGFHVQGLTRSTESAEKLKAIGVEPIVGDLSDVKLLAKLAADADIVVDAADSDNENAVKTIVSALSGSDKIFIHTSGSSVVADQANGEPSDKIFNETTEYTPEEHKQARVNIDKFVLASAKDGIRSVVICPCMIYGKGLGIKAESIQIPMMIKQAVKTGDARHIGRGENIWSNVHIEDLADLYLLAIEKAPTGGVFLFAENGEASLKQLVEKIRESLALKSPVAEWPIDDAVKEWGFEGAVFAFGSNSRIRGEKSRELGWKPTKDCVLEDVRRVCALMVSSSHA